MLRNLMVLATSVVVVLGLSGTAPGGPGDSDPIIGFPHVIVHPPAYLPALPQGQFTVWVHDHHMDCGATPKQDVQVIGSQSGPHTVTVIEWEIIDRGDGSWDERWVISAEGLEFAEGETLTWVALTTDDCRNVSYAGEGTTIVGEGEKSTL